MDVQAVLKEYLRVDREITEKAKDILQKRNLPYEQFGKIKRALAGEKAFGLGEEALDWMTNQMLESFMQSPHIDEIFAEDTVLRKRMADILKKHMQVDEELDEEVRRRIKNLQEGTATWEIEYGKVLDQIKRNRGSGPVATAGAAPGERAASGSGRRKRAGRRLARPRRAIASQADDGAYELLDAERDLAQRCVVVYRRRRRDNARLLVDDHVVDRARPHVGAHDRRVLGGGRLLAAQREPHARDRSQHARRQDRGQAADADRLCARPASRAGGARCRDGPRRARPSPRSSTGCSRRPARPR